MINAFCTTCLDDYQNEIWPTVFITIPHKGDYVKSKNEKILKVCCITHQWGDKPFVKIKLNK